MKCDEIREMLSLYIDNMLDESERKTVEDHLSACDVCRNEYNEIKETIDLLGQTEMVPVPDAFRLRLKQALQEEKRNMTGGEIAVAVPRKKIKWRVVTSVAAVFVVGVLSFGFYHDILGSLPAPMSSGGQAETAQPKEALNADDGKARKEAAPSDSMDQADAAATESLDEQLARLEKEADRLTGEIRAQNSADSYSSANNPADSQMSIYGAEAPAAEPEMTLRKQEAYGDTEAAETGNGASGGETLQDEKYYDGLVRAKLKGFDYQILDSSQTETGEWQYRVFIFRGNDGNTYNEEILIIGKEGEIKAILPNKFTELLNDEDDNN